MAADDRARWDERWAGREPSPPSLLVTALDDVLPRSGRALDVGGGDGRHAVWLARRGLDATVADVSPVALDAARARAREAGVDVETVEADLEATPLPDGPWDVIVQFHYLHRPLMAAYAGLLAPGGALVVVHPTKRNLKRHEHPSERWLLDDGELRRLVPGKLRVLAYDEGWWVEGRYEARLLAIKRDGRR